ncbi:hypothetical protein [Streptomyces sp. NPDC056796]|uniref:hypothetical protein n=1 Tax=Streptomyces sp. NPDC056796 TaxID=3345947 RepID=UPI00368A931D
MSIRYVRDMRRAGAAALLAATLALTTAACGGDDGKNEQGAGPASSSAPSKEKETADADGETLPDTSKVLVTVKGENGIDLIVHVAERDTGGFLTLTGEFKNTSGSRVVTPVQWSGTEEAVARTGPSLAAMTLVDSQEKKRYYVLRDTDNRPLTTTSYDSGIDAGKSLPFFAQFPAPAQTTTEVDLQFPGFTTAKIEIS